MSILRKIGEFIDMDVYYQHLLVAGSAPIEGDLNDLMVGILFSDAATTREGFLSLCDDLISRRPIAIGIGGVNNALFYNELLNQASKAVEIESPIMPYYLDDDIAEAVLDLVCQYPSKERREHWRGFLFFEIGCESHCEKIVGMLSRVPVEGISNRKKGI